MKNAPTLQEIQESIAILERQGLIRDSGKRRGGKIVWEAVPPDDYTSETWKHRRDLEAHQI